MHGNVWEWVQDTYHSDYDGAPNDGSAWGSGDGADRVQRGGSWNNVVNFFRSADRSCADPGICSYGYGFRLLEET